MQWTRNRAASYFDSLIGAVLLDVVAVDIGGGLVLGAAIVHNDDLPGESAAAKLTAGEKRCDEQLTRWEHCASAGHEPSAYRQ